MKIRNLKAQLNRKAMRVSIAVLATACVLLALIFRDAIGEWIIWLVENEGVSISAIVQSIVLVIATVVGLPLALWRSIVADRQSKAAIRQSEAAIQQSKTATEQSKTAIQQSNTARLSLLNERFQQGVAMLTGPQLVNRLSGISILEQLAKESVESHHVLVLGQFCIFVCNPPKEEDNEVTENEQIEDEGSRSRVPALRPELQAIICALENRSNEGRAVEKEQNFVLDFSGAKLAYAKFRNGDWSSIRLESADLRNAFIEHCNMKGGFLPGVCIAGAEITESNLSEAILFRGNFGKSKLRAVDLPKANLEYGIFHSAVIQTVDFTGANLRYTDFTGAIIIDVDFLDADLTGADFSGAIFINVKNLTKRQMAKTVGTPDTLPDLPD